MQHFYKFTFILLLCASPSLIWAQVDSLSTDKKPKKVERPRSFDPETVFFTFQEADGLSLAKVPEWMQNHLKGAEYKALPEGKRDELGYSHHTYQQIHQGIEVENGLITAHIKNGKVTAINGKHPQTPLPANVAAALSEDAAKTVLLQHIGAKSYMKTDYPISLLIAKDHNNAYRLAYKIRIDASDPFAMSQYYVDAQTGEVFKAISLIAHSNTPGTATTKYNGVQTITTDSYNGGYRLKESGAREIQTFEGSHATFNNGFSNAPDFTDADNNWRNTLQSLSVTVSVNPSWWNDFGTDPDPFPNIFVVILNGNSDTVYISPTQLFVSPSFTFGNINLALANTPYSMTILEKDIAGANDIAGTFTLTTATGTNSYSNSNCSGNYLVSMAHPALDVHWGIEKTYDFYVDKFGRHSFDGNGTLIKNYVGVTDAGFSGAGLPNNAFALAAPYNVMVYGNGNGQLFGSLVSLDVTGHEYSHLVINNNGHQGLNYQGESGALNESFADIFGTAIEFYTKPATANWTIGEQVTLPSPYYLRSMSNPNSSQNPQPKTYGDNLWQNPLCNNPGSSNDNCGVHNNSGVQNFWFYLVSQGGSGTNYFGDTYSVTGIGINKADSIAYRNLTTYLTTTNATYQDACIGSLQAAEDLYGNPSAAYSAVLNAWYAVNVGDFPVNFNIISATAPYRNILSWTYQYNSIAYDYQIERKTGTNGTFSWVGTVTGGITTFTDNNIQPNTQYCYRVKAVNGILISQYSDTKCITTPLAPTTPTNLNATTVSNSSIQVTWADNASTESGYILEYSMGGNSYTVWDTFPANTTSYTHTGLPNNAHFYYKVRALAYNFVSAYSNIDDAYTQSVVTTKQINKLEYYIDTDPGLNNGTNVPITATTYLDKNFTVSLSAVSNGLHTLYVRVKDDYGKWSQIYSRSFVKLAGSAGSLTVNKMEYYIDSDPGLGSGTDVPVTANASINNNFNVNLSAVSNGLHTFYVRVRDNQGKWSQIYSRSFVKLAGSAGSLTVNKMEYYIDSDPGLGSGTDVPVTANASINKNFNVDLSSVTSGLHTLYVRTRDNQGKWSQIYSRSFVSTQGNGGSPTITQLEYYWDTDPGFGNGLQIPVVPLTSINVNGIVSLANLPLGYHTLYIRAKDSRNLWSHIYSDTVKSSSVTADFTYNPTYQQVVFTNTSTSYGGTPAYSWNFGNGNTYMGANPSTQNFASTCPYNVCLTATLNGDTSTVCKTVSPYYPPVITANQTSICVGGTVSFTNTILGTTTPYTRQWQVSTDNITFSNIANAISSSYSVTLNTSGTYYYRLAVIKSGTCAGYSNVSTVTVVPDPSISLVGAATFCGNGSTTFTATPQGGTGTCTLLWQQYIGTVWANIAAPGINTYTSPNLTATRGYRVRISCTGSGCGLAYSNQQNLTINPLPSVTVNPTAATICVGGTKSITAGGANTYTWSPLTGLNSTTNSVVLATPTATTTYTVTGTNTTTGCVKSASSVITVVPDPAVSISGASTLCLNGTATLTSTLTGGTGSFTYTWQVSANGTTGWAYIAANAASSSYQLTGSLVGSKYYRLKLMCSGAGCSSGIFSNVWQVTTAAMPTISLAANTNVICTGGAPAMTTTATGGTGTATYIWQNSTNGGTSWTNIAGANTGSYTPAPLSANTGYRVTVTYSGIGCGSVTSNVFNVSINPDPTISIIGGGTYCGSHNGTFTATTTSGVGTCTVQWQEYLGNAWTNIAGATGATYTSPTLSSSKSYRAYVSCTGSGCGLAYSNIGAVTINGLPTVTTNTSTYSMCAGSSKSITASGANSYSWSPATGLNTTTNGTVIATPSNTITYTVTGTNTTTGCINTATSVITIIPNPTASINGPNSVVSGSIANLTSSASGGTAPCTYQWQTSTNGTTWTNISGATAATYTTPALTSAKYYRLTLTCTGTCNTSLSNVLLINVTNIRKSFAPIAVNIFPNPTRAEVNISLENIRKGDAIKIKIMDMRGQEIETYEEISQAEKYDKVLNIKTLAQGMYLIEITVGAYRETVKVMKE